ncbi:efflux transporter [Salix suchowensis]|nr:efflux transporter [Salix suchowensis]
MAYYVNVTMQTAKFLEKPGGRLSTSRRDLLLLIETSLQLSKTNAWIGLVRCWSQPASRDRSARVEYTMYVLAYLEVLNLFIGRIPDIIVLLILGVCMVVLFVLWQQYLEKVQASDTKSRGPYAFLTPPPLMKVRSTFGNSFAVSGLESLRNQLPCHTALLPGIPSSHASLDYGVLCNIAVALVVNRLSVIYLLGGGTILTAAGAVLFAVIIPSSPYWAFGFPAAIIAVFGADFTFSAGSLFVARVALPHEQSVAGALFNTMTQVSSPSSTVRPAEVQSPIKNFAAAVTALAFFRGFGIVGHRKEDEDDNTVTSSGKNSEV